MIKAPRPRTTDETNKIIEALKAMNTRARRTRRRLRNGRDNDRHFHRPLFLTGMVAGIPIGQAFEHRRLDSRKLAGSQLATFIGRRFPK
jgi:hypothetical protein